MTGLVERGSPDAAIGERIHHLMWRQRLTQKEIAAQLGMTQAGLSKKMRGERPWFAAELVSVAQILDGLPGPNKAHRISMRANTYLHELGIAETLHQARHRFASSTYQACRDIRAVQDLLGHASPTTTAIYAAVASNVAREAVESAAVLALPVAA